MTRWPRSAVIAELRRHCATGGHSLPEHLTLAGLRPLAGGRNNAVFAWSSAPGQDTEIIKLYKNGERGRGERGRPGRPACRPPR